LPKEREKLNELERREWELDKRDVARIKRGDAQGYQRLYCRYWERLRLKFARRPAPATAVDCASEALLRLFESIKTGEGYDPSKGRAFPYLVRTGNNYYSNIRRQSKHVIHFPVYGKGPRPRGTSPDDKVPFDQYSEAFLDIFFGKHEWNLHNREAAEINSYYSAGLVKDFMKSLSVRDRDYFRLKYFKGKNSNEIEKLRGVKAHTIRQRMSRAIRKFTVTIGADVCIYYVRGDVNRLEQWERPGRADYHLRMFYHGCLLHHGKITEYDRRLGNTIKDTFPFLDCVKYFGY